MNVIYLNENLQYCEAFPDSTGKVLLPENNVICGFVDKGMLWALKDPNNEILTPIEMFIQFNDLSVEFIQPQHFKGAQRIINLDGRELCEKGQVFSCTNWQSENTIMQGVFSQFFGYQSLPADEVGQKWYPVNFFVKLNGANNVKLNSHTNYVDTSQKLRIDIPAGFEYIRIYHSEAPKSNEVDYNRLPNFYAKVQNESINYNPVPYNIHAFYRYAEENVNYTESHYSNSSPPEEQVSINNLTWEQFYALNIDQAKVFHMDVKDYEAQLVPLP